MPLACYLLHRAPVSPDDIQDCPFTLGRGQRRRDLVRVSHVGDVHINLRGLLNELPVRHNIARTRRYEQLRPPLAHEVGTVSAHRATRRSCPTEEELGGGPSESGRTAGEEAQETEDRLPRQEPGQIGEDAVHQPREVELARLDELDQRLLRRVEGPY